MINTDKLNAENIALYCEIREAWETVLSSEFVRKRKWVTFENT